MRPKNPDEVYIPIEKLLLPDTPKSLKIKTLRGKESRYFRILGWMEFAIANLYTEMPSLTDRDVKEALLSIGRDYAGIPAADELDLKDMLKWTLSMGLRDNPVTRHEFLLCLRYIADAIDVFRWADGNGYLETRAMLYGLLEKDWKGTNGGRMLDGKLAFERYPGGECSFIVPRSWGSADEMVFDALEMVESGDSKKVQKGFAMLESAVEMAPHHPLALSQLGFFLSENGYDEGARKHIEKVVEDGRKLFPKDFSPGKDTLPWGLPRTGPSSGACTGLDWRR